MHGLKDNMVTMATPTNVIYRFADLPVKVPVGAFAEIDIPILKFMQKCERL